MTRGQGGERRVRRQSLPSFGKFRRDLSHRQPTWTRLTQSTHNCQFSLTVGALVLQVTLNVQARTHAGLHSTESTCAVGRSTACPPTRVITFRMGSPGSKRKRKRLQ
jgi:hypothetical protein